MDGNLLAPLILAGTVDLHPVAIITAILFFGGIWGFWGIFFAIPLASFLNAVLLAWRELQEMVAQERQDTQQSGT
jgi:putative permease